MDSYRTADNAQDNLNEDMLRIEDHALTEIDAGMGELLLQTRQKNQNLKDGGHSGLTGEFGKLILVDNSADRNSVNPVSSFEGNFSVDNQVNPVSSFEGNFSVDNQVNPISSFEGNFSVDNQVNPVSSFEGNFSVDNQVNPISSFEGNFSVDNQNKVNPVSSFEGNFKC